MFENLNFDADLRSGLLAAEAVGTEHGMPAKMDPEDKIIATSLTSQVERYIIALIRREQLKPGDAIPSEMQLVEQLGLSRSVVREAFRSLAALGIVEIRSGRKPRVKTFDSSVLELLLNFAACTAQVSLEQILEVRTGMEIYCASLAAQRITPDEEQALVQETCSIEKYISDPEAFISHDLRFHRLLAQAAHNFLYALMLQALHQQIHQSITAGLALQQSAEERARIVTLHQDICMAVCAHDAEKAAAAMRRHFAAVEQAAAAAAAGSQLDIKTGLK